MSGVDEGAVLDDLHARFGIPRNRDEAARWRPRIEARALHRCVLVVAKTRIEGAWAAYCSNVPGECHAEEAAEVLRTGDKLHEDFARAMFPSMDGLRYAP